MRGLAETPETCHSVVTGACSWYGAVAPPVLGWKKPEDKLSSGSGSFIESLLVRFRSQDDGQSVSAPRNPPRFHSASGCVDTE